MTCVLCADHEEGGKLTERERIVKLLEQTGFTWHGTKQNLDLGKDELLALIKGENK